MNYGYRRTQDSISRAIPLLLASGSLGLLAIVWRRLYAPRREARMLSGAQASRALPDAPSPVRADEQPVHSGSGALFHRQYEVVISGTPHSCRELLRMVQQNLAALAPSMLAHFEKTAGVDDLLRVGDEYEITMLGPWNGAVRVSESTADSFTLVTLEGHPEAGHITFSVAEHGSGIDAKRVRIESWARARDAVVAVAYSTIGIGKQVQTEMWITFLQRLSTLAGAAGTPEVVITTEEISVPDSPDASTPRETHD